MIYITNIGKKGGNALKNNNQKIQNPLTKNVKKNKKMIKKQIPKTNNNHNNE